MHLFRFILVIGILIGMCGIAHAQMDEDAGELSNFADDELPPQEPAKQAADAEMVIDAETVPEKDEEAQTEKVDFIGIGATQSWVKRNGLGAHFAIGGYTCYRDYCNLDLDTQIVGSIAGTLGAYYRMNPNLSFFGDVTFAYVNTNFDGTSIASSMAEDDKAFGFQFIAGAAFHVPVRGWLDLYGQLGLGPILLRAIATIDDDEYKHRWGGLDIEMGFGANFYFWSVGFLKNFSLGPYFKFGFPIWFRVCDRSFDSDGECASPSEMESPTGNHWADAPFTFQAGIEARYDFSFEFGKSKKKPSGDARKSDDSEDKKEVEANANWDL